MLTIPKPAFRVAVIFLALVVMLVSLPFLQHWLKPGDYYGHYTSTSVPGIPNAPVLEDGLNIVFFGFGACTQTCPVQLANLLTLQPHVDPEKVRFVYVALDADIQDQEALGSAFETWGPSFKAVVPASLSAAQKLALEYGGFASDRGNTASPADRFDHDGRLYVVNDENQKVLTYSSPALDIELVADDLTTLINSL